MQALEIYGSRRTGDEWKHITAFVGSRTVQEVRLHGRQYLQRLVQQLPPSPEATQARRYLSSSGNQNDPNRQNYQIPRVIPSKAPQPRVPIGGSRTLSAAALECAQSMNVQVPLQFRNQPIQHLQQQQAGTLAPHRNGRRSITWTFQEEKAFETVLAGWAGNKPYSWVKIAAALPGKTAKDVRNHYDEMLGEVACIEAGQVVPEIPTSSSAASGVAITRSKSSPSTLSQRAVPPPPIEVPPRSVGKGSSTRSRRGSASGFTMLSPTFLDLLAKEAESEEKSPLPFPGLTNLPSPLFSPTLLPSGSPGFFSPGNKKSAARGQQDKKFSSDVTMEDVDPKTSTTADKKDDPRRSSTPRIWNELLVDDFKFEDPVGVTSTGRKTPRSKSTTKTSVSDNQDAEMTDASAA
ncbi:hypothetical protein PHMEG_0009643 [Phytophthora megakarya]|uniref:Myb-like domain-containing protein n=1 Tax=Phytophthora megakarya TaxID=4795 RepID=A0A225WG06_9STRA|nr:hypothetical protein PHMEG_0009643 [Phytophthora megakarya]